MTTDFDTVLQRIGGFGRYQIFTFFILSFTGFGVAFHNFIHVFTGTLPPYLCANSGDDLDHSAARSVGKTPHGGTGLKHSNRTSVISYQDLTSSVLLSENVTLISCASVVAESDAGFYNSSGRFTFNSSAIHVRQDLSSSECSLWIFDRSVYQSTVGTEWALVCERRWLLPLMQSLHMVGALIGAFLGGIAADRLGRRPTLLAATLLELASGIATAFAPSLAVYGLLRLAAGIAVSALYNAVFITSVELVTPRWRLAVGTGLVYVNALGCMLLALLAYMMRSWRQLQLVASSVLGVHLLYFWLVPESPRWLLVRGRHIEAATILQRICKVNRRQWPDDVKLAQPTNSEQRSSVADLMRTPKIRSRTVKISFVWIGLCISYYGLSLYTSELDGDNYINFLLSGVVELPALTFAIIADRWFGRRTLLAGPLAFAAVALLVVAPIPETMAWLRVTLAMTGKLGLSAAFTTVYPFTVELFPTCLRSNGLGVSSVFARGGGLIAPFIALLNVHGRLVPLLLCGALAFVSCFLVLLLPETSQLPLAETIADAESSTVPETVLRHVCFRRRPAARPESTERSHKCYKDLEVAVDPSVRTKLMHKTDFRSGDTCVSDCTCGDTALTCGDTALTCGDTALTCADTALTGSVGKPNEESSTFYHSDSPVL